MSNIIKDNSIIDMLVDAIKYIDSYEITKSFVEELLSNLIPDRKGKKLVAFSVDDEYILDGSVCFLPRHKIIKINLDKLFSLLRSCSKVIANESNLDEATIRKYQLIQIISHEVEHAYQFLISKRLVEVPSVVLANAYRILYRVVTSRKSSTLKNLYNEMYPELLLERNAQIESLDLIMKCAEYSGEENVYNAYKKYIDEWYCLGYENGLNGSIIDTFCFLQMDDQLLKFYHDEDLNDEERIRYGFPITEGTYKLILKNKNS